MPPVDRARVRHARPSWKEFPMRLGTSIVLLALGAILAFAVQLSVRGLDVQVVGWILMAAGALGVVLELAVWSPRRRRVVTSTDPYAPAGRTTVQDDRF
jgi:Domain of unknown function (DUF6458)